MSKPWVTASSIERVINCAASAVLPQTQSTSSYAKGGHDEHAILEDVVLGNREHPRFQRNQLEIPNKAVPEVAFSYDVVTGEAKDLGRVKNRDYPKSPFSTLFGTVDVVGESVIHIDTSQPDAEEVRCVDVVDWKTTYEAPPNDSWQMRLLAMCAAKARGLVYARTRITHIRDEYISHSTWKLWTNDDFADTERQLKKAYDTVNKLGWKDSVTLSDVRHGPHCHFCPAYLSCPYPRALLQQSLAGDVGRIISGVDAASAYNKWQALRTLTGRMEDAIKVYASNQTIDVGKGYLFGRRASDGKFSRFKAYKEEE